jgi:arsenate reductase
VAQRVLFVCSANSARSQMAEAFLRTLAGDAFEADSAGSQPEPVHPLAIAVMSECGIDISDQRSKGLHEYMGKTQFDHLITVCDRAEKACPIFPGKGAREYWPMDDPLRAQGSEEERLEKFREIRDLIEARVRRWLVEHRYKSAQPLRAEAAPVGDGAA